MLKKEMMKKEKKYDGNSIASFVISLANLPTYILWIIFPVTYFSLMISVISIIFGSFGLSIIKRNNNLKGKSLAIIGIIISSLFIIWTLYFILTVLFNPHSL